MLTLFADIHPYAQHRIDVDAPHNLYLEESGNPDGIPIVFLHGGPGLGCEPWNRRFFDPQVYRIILFDQRGCGRSTPHACIENNTTADLVADMEKIRRFLQIEKWVLFGGSWGSTLALAYAQSHPEQVMAMILRGIFLCRKQEIQWFYQHGANQIFADHWQDFIRPLNAKQQKNIVQSYYQLLQQENELKQLALAKNWALWEARCANLQTRKSVLNHFGDAHTALSLALIETHYFVHDSFLKPNQLLDHCKVISDIPTILVQGRYDMICPLTSAYELHQHLSQSRLEIVAVGAHSAKDEAMVDALIRATNEVAKLYTDQNY